MPVELVNPYCTLDDVQKETRNSKTDKEDWMRTCINFASRVVEEYCRRDFKHHVFDDNNYFWVPRNAVFEDTLFLPFKINTITGLWVVENRSVGPTAGSLWPASDYFFEPNAFKGTGRIVADNGDIFGPYPFKNNLALQGDFGYEVAEGDVVSADLPGNVRKATMMIAAVFSMERRLEQTNLEGNRIELIELIVPREVWPMLNRFRETSHML